MKTSLPDIGIYGTGNLAWKLGEALLDAGYPIISIWGRNRSDKQALARRLNARALDAADEHCHAGVKLLLVSDAAIAPLAQEIAVQDDALVVHCAGAGELAWLNPHTRAGILWPLQAIRKELPLIWEAVPLLVDANQSADLDLLLEMGKRLSGQVKAANGLERSIYHTAAVLAGNFGNLLLDQAYALLKSHDLDHRLLIPILEQQLKQFAADQRPLLRQTGPATRGDQATMQKHLAILSHQPAASAIYRLLSELIAQQQKKD